MLGLINLDPIMGGVLNCACYPMCIFSLYLCCDMYCNIHIIYVIERVYKRWYWCELLFHCLLYFHGIYNAMEIIICLLTLEGKLDYYRFWCNLWWPVVFCFTCCIAMCSCDNCDFICHISNFTMFSVHVVCV